MSDVWSRAFCESQKVPNFAVKGITPSNEIRDPPNYLRPVTSEPTDHDSTCELSRSPSPDVSGTLCYNLRRKVQREKPAKQITQSQPIPPKARYGTEKVPNFRAPSNPSRPSSPVTAAPKAPLSPGRVRVCRQVSRTSSSAGSGYQYTVNSCTPSPTTPDISKRKTGSPSSEISYSVDRSPQPPSRNSAYSPPPASSPKSEQAVERGNDPTSSTYLNSLEEENKQLRSLLLAPHAKLHGRSHDSIAAENDVIPAVSEKVEIKKKSEETYFLFSPGDLLNKGENDNREVTQAGVKNANKTDEQAHVLRTNYACQNGRPMRPNTDSVNHPILNLPEQLSPSKPNKPHSLRCATKSPKARKPSYIFVGRNGEVLAESKGSKDNTEVVVKKLEESVKSEKRENGETKPWEQLRQISSTLEKNIICQASVDMISYPCVPMKGEREPSQEVYLKRK